MKTPITIGCGLLVVLSCQGQSLNSQATQVTIPAATPYEIIKQNGNSQVWERTTYELDPNGQAMPKLQQYTEMASGLNHLVNGQWVASSETIQILPNGTAVATNGQHQAYFPGDIAEGEIQLVTPDGKHLVSQPVGLSYFDGVNTVAIAELTNSTGLVSGDNQVIYPNAFTEVKADLRYTYTKAGFEQDVILRQRPPTPESLGLNPDTARLQVMTIFYNPPQPTIQTTVLPAQAGLSLQDQILNFGMMQMAQGKAFLLGQNETDAGALVSKNWVTVSGQQVLIEEVPVDAIVGELAALPLTAMNRTKHPMIAMKDLQLPVRNHTKSNAKMMIAKAEEPTKGLVLDYQTLNSSLTNYTFQGDMTYYISGTVNLYQTNTFEGGTVLKYATNGSVSISSGSAQWIVWGGSAYRPVVFTAKDNNNIGATITGSSGSPSGYYGNPMLSFSSSYYTPTMNGWRVSYAATALQSLFSGGNVYNAQFVNCQNGLTIGGALVLVGNALFANVITNFVLPNYGGAGVNAQNATFAGSKYLVSGPTTQQGCAITLTNCILANVTNLAIGVLYSTNGNYNGLYNSQYYSWLGSQTFTNTFNPFQKVGGGSYYLTNAGNFFGQGTTNVDPTLLTGLKTRSTRVPTLYSNLTSLTNITLNPTIARDNGSSLDLGYHYDTLDYAIGGSDLYTNLTVSAGVAIGWFDSVGAVNSSSQGYGISINKGGNLSYSGTVTSPCWMARYDTVQEGNWTSRGYFGALMLSTSGSGAIPQLNATFTKWSGVPSDGYNFRDNYANGTIIIANCEFYINSYNVYDVSSLFFTNCLFYRDQAYSFNYLSPNAPNTTFFNCAFYNGMLVLTRYAGQPVSQWVIENTAFDGTGFSYADNYNGSTNYTTFDYNAYNTNNNSGLSYSYPYSPAPTNRLWVIGTHDTFVGTYNWQSSWFGSFYQLTTSPLIDAGSTTANLVGLYHYTVTTDQTVEGNSTVDIGYHYVAADGNGNPLDYDSDGIPDYLEDANGNGLVDSGETSWLSATDLGLKVWIMRPRNGMSPP